MPVGTVSLQPTIGAGTACRRIGRLQFTPFRAAAVRARLRFQSQGARHVCRAEDQKSDLRQGQAIDGAGAAKTARELTESDLDALEEDELLEDEEEQELHGLEKYGFEGPLTNVQEQYKQKLKQKLEEEEEAERRRRAERAAEFEAGKRAYEKGLYRDSVKLLERALNNEGWMSALGGDIQMWLALAYQACGRDKDCIDLYKKVEDTHPLRKVRQQAANLRFIMEAPKLKRGPDEVVKIPVIEAEARKQKRGFTRPPVPTAALPSKRKKSLEEQFLDNYQPPRWTRNRYVWWASGILGLGLAVYSASLAN